MVYVFLNILPWVLSGTPVCQILIANEAAANLPHCVGGSLCVEAVVQSRGILCLKLFIINRKHRKWMDSSFLRSCVQSIHLDTICDTQFFQVIYDDLEFLEPLEQGWRWN